MNATTKTRNYQIARIGKNKAAHAIRIDEDGDIRTLCMTRYHIEKSGEPVKAEEVTYKMCLSMAKRWLKEDGVTITFD